MTRSHIGDGLKGGEFVQDKDILSETLSPGDVRLTPDIPVLLLGPVQKPLYIRRRKNYAFYVSHPERGPHPVGWALQRKEFSRMGIQR